MPERGYTIDATNEMSTVLVGLAGHQFQVYDLRKMAGGVEDPDMSIKPAYSFFSPLKTQTRACKLWRHSDRGCVIGSSDGRASVYPFYTCEGSLYEKTKSDIKFKFRAHHVDGVMYPLNVVEFHPKKDHVVATGGMCLCVCVCVCVCYK